MKSAVAGTTSKAAPFAKRMPAPAVKKKPSKKGPPPIAAISQATSSRLPSQIPPPPQAPLVVLSDTSTSEAERDRQAHRKAQRKEPPSIAATSGPSLLRRLPSRIPRSPSQPPPLALLEMHRDTSEAERDRQAHRQAQRGCAAKRSATASRAHEERADIEARGAATATKDAVKKTCIARLFGAEATTEVMATGFSSTSFSEGFSNTEKYVLQQRLRGSRDSKIREHLTEGRAVFYKSSGNSMWPLAQSDDACTFFPIQAVTAKNGVLSEPFKIGVGDVVFCQVQRSQLYYAHIVLEIQEGNYRQEPKYWIGNIEGHRNGWCHREHIFGILVEVQVWWKGQYYTRPHPKDVFAEVVALVKEDRWSSVAAKLCEPLREA